MSKDLHGLPGQNSTLWQRLQHWLRDPSQQELVLEFKGGWQSLLQLLEDHLQYFSLGTDQCAHLGFGKAEWGDSANFATQQFPEQMQGMFLAPFPDGAHSYGSAGPMEFIQTDFACHVSANVCHFSRREKAVLECIDAEGGEYTDPPVTLNQQDIPTRDDWLAALDKILGKLKQGQLEKLVFGRQRRLNLSKRPRAHGVLPQLYDKNPGAFLFWILRRDASCFFGASPEIILRHKNGLVSSDSLAGTVALSGEQNRDRQLAADLMASAKDLREQEIVTQFVHRTLAEFSGQEVEESGLELKQAGQLLHIYKSLKTRLRTSQHILGLLAQLHPTPALAGWPTEQAIQVICEFETQKRACFGGLVGHVGMGHFEAAVAIRSALLKGRKCLLFAGAGILAESNPQREWEETEHKLQTIASVFHTQSAEALA